MNIIEIITKKRDKRPLTKEEISFFVNGYTKGEIPEYQISSLLMAIVLNGMDDRETADLTQAMAYSGKRLDLSSVGFTIDKHSTGGVGDKTKIVVVPLAASLGLKVPTTFGRGLGHTGGTRDKLESIPGFRITLSENEILSRLKDTGAVMMGASDDIAPADKKIYALRDVTGTVASIPLITSSILSKKLAEGTDAFVFDVKAGSGAFMKTVKDAEKLARLMVATSKLMNKKAVAVISDMNQPLGYAVGNSLEVAEAVDTLKGEGPKDLALLALTLTAHMLVLAGKAKTFDQGFKMSAKNLLNNSAYKKFLEIVSSQGGDTSYIENTSIFPKACIIKEICAVESGWIAEMNTYEIGMIANLLGAGRTRIEDNVDHSAGIIFNKKTGEKVARDEKICEIHTNKAEVLDEARQRILAAVKVSRKKQNPPKLIYKTIK